MSKSPWPSNLRVFCKGLAKQILSKCLEYLVCCGVLGRKYEDVSFCGFGQNFWDIEFFSKFHQLGSTFEIYMPNFPNFFYILIWHIYFRGFGFESSQVSVSKSLWVDRPMSNFHRKGIWKSCETIFLVVLSCRCFLFMVHFSWCITNVNKHKRTSSRGANISMFSYLIT